MKYTFLASIAAICLTLSYAHEPPKPGLTVRGEVTEVHDGDTVTVEVKTKFHVRLLDCWAPEVKVDNRLPKNRQAAEKAAGIASRDHLQELCQGKTVIVHIPSHNDDLLKSTSMGRMLANVWIEGDTESLSEKQVKAGFATTTQRDDLK